MYLIGELVLLHNLYRENQEAMENAFARNAKMDVDGLDSFLGEHQISSSSELLSLVFAVADTDGDRKLKLHEFTQMIAKLEDSTPY